MHLKATGIGHRFGRNILFRDLSLDVHGGESVAVTGSNGSGKSTLLHILAGLVTPRRGSVSLDLNGESVEPSQRPFKCGFVAPYLNVYDGFSVTENLEFIARARGLKRQTSLVKELITEVGLTDRANDLVGTFSSGMKQRVRLAIAIMSDPPVLLLDEPTTTLDEAGRELVERIRVRQIARHGIVILATNDPVEAASCDRNLNVESYRPVSASPVQ